MTMTVEEILELREKGCIEEAYDAIRQLYAADKGTANSTAMFRIATDILKKRLHENRVEEANKILLALERMMPRFDNRDEGIREAFEECRALLNEVRQTKRPPQHIEMGVWGEQVAADYLIKKGYSILERDWRSGHRDIDLVALYENQIVFIEVKTRMNDDLMDPVKAVNYRKRKNLRHAINNYVNYRRFDYPIRFDIITVVGKPGSQNPVINHLEDINIID